MTFTLASPSPVHARRSTTSTPSSPTEEPYPSSKGWSENDRIPSLTITKTSWGSNGTAQIVPSRLPSASMRTIGASFNLPLAIASPSSGTVPMKVPSRSGLSGLGGISSMVPKSTLGDTDPRNAPSRPK